MPILWCLGQTGIYVHTEDLTGICGNDWLHLWPWFTQNELWVSIQNKQIIKKQNKELQ